MTEPHWPADGSGDEADGGYDPTAYRHPGIDVERLAAAMRPVMRRMSLRHAMDPIDYERGFCEQLGPPTPAEVAAAYDRMTLTAPSDTYSPGDYESPRTAPFVQVRVNGELVPGHIVYPWPDGGLVVEPLEVAG